MCGICGVVQLGGPPRAVVHQDVLDRMTDTMQHRGPDDRGTYQAAGIALGARRLSIVDVVGGHQPIANEDGSVWAAQNGELYNHGEIRRDLERRGHRFYTSCDTEIIPHLYEAHGSRFASFLRGKFAIAVWDEQRRRAVLARDRLGVKPLYYARADDLLVFASELKAILASGLVDVALDFDAIDAYFTFGFVPGAATPLVAVRKLEPGELLTIEDGRIRTEQYWEFPQPAPRREWNEEELVAELAERLDDAVRARLMSDVPLGAMLSGGLDSSVVVAIMARHLSGPVKTFSVGFSDSDDSELPYARLVAERYGTDHHELVLSQEDPIDLPELVWALDEPLADLSALGFHALSRLAAAHVTVALSGQGADELFAGYGRYRTARLAEYWAHIPQFFRQAAMRAARPAPSTVQRRLRVLEAATSGEAQAARGAWNVLRPQLATGPLAYVDGRAPRRAIARRLSGLDAGSAGRVASELYLDSRLSLVDDMLHYFDRTSMAHSLEVRVPFLDHGLVEFSATVPIELKLRGRVTKYLLRRVAEDLVPPEILGRRKIGFFDSAVEKWFERQSGGIVAEVLLDRAASYTEFIDRHAIRGLLEQRHGAKVPGRARFLLTLLMLELWLSTFLPRAVRASDLRNVARSVA